MSIFNLFSRKNKKSATNTAILLGTYTFTDALRHTGIIKLYEDKTATFSYLGSQYVHEGSWKSNNDGPAPDAILDFSDYPLIFFSSNEAHCITNSYLTTNYLYNSFGDFFTENNQNRLTLSKTENNYTDKALDCCSFEDTIRPQDRELRFKISVWDFSGLYTWLEAEMLFNVGFSKTKEIYLIENDRYYTEDRTTELRNDIIRIVKLYYPHFNLYNGIWG